MTTPLAHLGAVKAGELPAAAAPQAASAASAERGKEADAALERATLQFEQLLLKELLQPVADAAGEEIPAVYREMLPDALAQAVADAGGVGLAEELQRALVEGRP
jgi:Rod binding domain-containing protein